MLKIFGLLTFVAIWTGSNLAGAADLTSSSAGRFAMNYAQILTNYAVYRNPSLLSAEVYGVAMTGTAPVLLASSPSVRATSAPPELIAGNGGGEAEIVSSPGEILLPLLAQDGHRAGLLRLAFNPGPENRDEAVRIRNSLARILPKPETLFDPYVTGYSADDTLAQKINQTLLARHPDVNVVAIHLTAPGDSKNKVWGINRPNFIGRDSDEIDTDTEKTGRVVMQVIPATHRMEVHMPLLTRNGRNIGTLCTVYFWDSLSEAADYYSRSLSMMEEARLLTPDDRSALFRP